MKVLLVNTSSHSGGAAVAASRLMAALQKSGISVKMVVLNKGAGAQNIIQLQPGWKRKFTFIRERIAIWLINKLNKKNLFNIDIANSGFDITSLREYKEADIIHLHWINQGMLSIQNLKKIINSGKKIVWTMHDMWPFTGICHYPGSCEYFSQHCGNCKYLVNPSEKDCSFKIWKKKKAIYKKEMIFVGCSRWISNEARKSSLLKENPIYSIPNPIDTTIFLPKNKKDARQALGLPPDKTLLLFGADRIDDERKGFGYLLKALQLMAVRFPERIENTEIIMFGNVKNTLTLDIPYKINHIGYITGHEKLVITYNAASLFIIPSLEDNLPNTIMEALACGVPCVGFNVGGIPEMIDHKINGYIAEPRNAGDLCKGIEWIIEENYSQLSQYAVGKVMKHYAEQPIASQYIQLYTNQP